MRHIGGARGWWWVRKSRSAQARPRRDGLVCQRMRDQQRRGWLQANFCGLLDELINRLVHPIREMAHWHCFCYGGRVSCSPALPPWLVTPRMRRQIWQLPEVSFSVREYGCWYVGSYN